MYQGARDDPAQTAETVVIPHARHSQRGSVNKKNNSFSTSEALDLLRQGSGSAYFVPTGYIPILVPDKEEDPDILRRLLESHVPTQVPVDSLWQNPLTHQSNEHKAKAKRATRSCQEASETAQRIHPLSQR